MRSTLIFLSFCLTFTVQVMRSQADSIQYKKTYTSLYSAMKEPDKVYRLNLSNLPADSFPIDLSKFKNLEYLCLNNDHIEFIPRSIGDLSKLKVLELNGDNFKTLPPEFSKLTNLQELYLNVNKNIDLTKSINVLSTLPRLSILHLENDGISMLPPNLAKLTHLEQLYLNNNKLTVVPTEFNSMKNLKYVEMQNNKIPPYKMNDNKGFGVKIKF
ncbi:MAG: leucine-rich repeat domain-containing protein [Bacteroidia bacterium]